jgi:hypothetical protein
MSIFAAFIRSIAHYAHHHATAKQYEITFQVVSRTSAYRCLSSGRSSLLNTRHQQHRDCQRQPPGALSLIISISHGHLELELAQSE